MIVSAASMSVAMRGRPCAGPASATLPFNSASSAISSSVFHPIPLPPLPSEFISGPSAVKAE